MNALFRYPQGLLLILLLIPALPLVILRFRRTLSSLGSLYDGAQVHRVSGLSLKGRFAGRILLWSAAWILLSIACSGPWIGEKAVPAGRRGKAAAFVFDISWSMTAEDVRPSRIQAASLYASALLERMEETPVSVILAKGDGITAIPLTEDYRVIAPLLGNLSPLLMSAPGTDLEKGVRAAALSLTSGIGGERPASLTGGTIIVFTDGDETSGSLEAAVTDAVRQGMTVIFAGFGRDAEVSVLTGDGVTTAMTALREQDLIQLTDKVNRRMRRSSLLLSSLPFGEKTSAVYIPALAQGSALEILDHIRDDDPSEGLTYKMERAGRAPVFAGSALLLFIAGLLVSEFRLPERKERRR
jgi:Ca-activated chloride channel family protein